MVDVLVDLIGAGYDFGSTRSTRGFWLFQTRDPGVVAGRLLCRRDRPPAANIERALTFGLLVAGSVS
jgi:hypothetical protein